MSTIPTFLKIDGEQVANCLQEACAKLDTTEGEAVLDFSSVHRIDPKAIREMVALVGLAEAKGIKIELAGVNVGIYKVLKLAKLAPRFRFRA